MDAAQSTGVGPLVCPFVALAEDRDHRADTPDERNRCYAERAPRQRDLSYQSEYCYSTRFAGCSVFLAWAARNAAEPAYVSDAARRAWGSGIAAPEHVDAEVADGMAAGSTTGPGSVEPLATPTPESGLFSFPDTDPGGRSTTEMLDWVSASAWADAPWDEEAEAEAEELVSTDFDAVEAGIDDEPVPGGEEEATTAPKVPAALPLRRRRRPQQPIRTRGSGEWFYADPLDREPLVKRRYGVAPPLLLGVLGLLVVAIVVFLLPTLLSGGDDRQTTAAASPSPDGAAPVAAASPRLEATPGTTLAPSPEASPRVRTYRVKAGDSLSGIAARFDVRLQHLQCLNGIRDRDFISIDQRLRIPPDGYSCTPGWRNATPEPEDGAVAEESAAPPDGAGPEDGTTGESDPGEAASPAA